MLVSNFAEPGGKWIEHVVSRLLPQDIKGHVNIIVRFIWAFEAALEHKVLRTCQRGSTKVFRNDSWFMFGVCHEMIPAVSLSQDLNCTNAGTFGGPSENSCSEKRSLGGQM